jgi:chemotaxis protein methyltransferase CheR
MGVANTEAREFAFTPRDLARVAALIHRRAGIVLNQSKEDMVYSRLARRLREVGLDSFKAYLDALEGGAMEAEWESFTNALTTNLTSFFREAHHFELLKEHLATLPPKPRHLIWCSAASTGEEPYSLAMAACEHYGTLNPPVAILATDIDTNVLTTAARGIYTLDRLDKLEKARKQQFFRRGSGDNAGHCKVIEPLQKLIHWRPLNLLDAKWGLKGPFDALFCRNVMIYFDKPTQHRIIERFLPLMAPHALLFAGHSESFFHCADLIRSRGRTVYEPVLKQREKAA